MVVLPRVFTSSHTEQRVKPLMADGTGFQSGRVGSCHIYLKEPYRNVGFLIYRELV